MLCCRLPVCLTLLATGIAAGEEFLLEQGPVVQAAILTDAGSMGENPIATDANESAGGFALKIKGKSGKFEYYQVLNGTDERKVEVKFDDLSELDAEGEEVGKHGDEKHSIKDFKNQDFEMSPVVDVSIGTAMAKLIRFSSNISTVGRLRVDTYIISEGGIAGPEGDEWHLFPGNLKFNIAFEYWSFCAPCEGKNGEEEFGKFLEFEIEIKGKKLPKKKKGGKGGKGDFELGGGLDVLLTDKYSADGQEYTMPAEYPYVKTKGNKQVFVFRFPQFNNSLVYDPVLGAERVENPDDGATGIGAGSFALLAGLVACTARSI